MFSDVRHLVFQVSMKHIHALSILWKATLDGRGIWVAVRPQRTESDSDEGVAPSLCQDEVWPLGCDVSGWMISVSSKDYVLSPPFFFEKDVIQKTWPTVWFLWRGYVGGVGHVKWLMRAFSGQVHSTACLLPNRLEVFELFVVPFEKRTCLVLMYWASI